MKRLVICSMLAGLVSLPSVALAESAARGSFRVSVRVPEHCEISASPLFAAQGDGMVSGTVFESCNTQDGFQVVASHRPLEANELVAFDYAGATRYLQAHGWSEVANRTGAKHGVRPISVRYTSLASPLAINLTITMF